MSLRLSDLVPVATSLQKQSKSFWEKIETFSHHFPQILETSLNLMKWYIPSNSWFQLFSTKNSNVKVGGMCLLQIAFIKRQNSLQSRHLFGGKVE